MVKSHRLKFLGLWLLHKFNRRYLSVNFDPVMACNLRCQMCHFSEKDFAKDNKGIFPPNDLDLWAQRILSRALKLQIGCAAEPTIYRELARVIALGKQYNVPHIALTTNAILLEERLLKKWMDIGLNEVTVSLHGVYKTTYETLMQQSDYSKFHQALATITQLKKQYPKFNLRLNYTFNLDNFNELKDFFEVFGQYDIDILQIRPIRSLGNTVYQKFDISSLVERYGRLIEFIKKECQKRKILLLAPDNLSFSEGGYDNTLFQYTYCYIGPNQFWHDDFDWKNESFNDYACRVGWSKRLLNNVFRSKESLNTRDNEHLKYTIN